jgi:methylglutaconyl-CoA hydratase
MAYETIEISKNDDTIIVSLNRPDVHNAMNELLMKELTYCFKDLSKDKDVRCVVLTGNGKSFCAGADLNWMRSMINYKKEENIKDSSLLLNLYEAIYSCPKPVIGKINGHAFGGGVGLISVCDVAVSIPNRKFAFSEANLGLIPSVISTYVALRMKKADMRRFFITAEIFDSETAHSIGLIDYVVPPEKFNEKIEECIKLVSSSGPIAIGEIKSLIDNMSKMDIKSYKEFTVEKISELRISAEGQEGINAFLDKRKPSWSK